MKIVIAGPKCSGKTTIGSLLAENLGIEFVETDTLIEKAYGKQHDQALSFYEICKALGEDEFRRYERQAVEQARSLDWCVLSTGGSTFLHGDSRRQLRENAIVVSLTAPTEVLWERLVKQGKSKYLNGQSPEEAFQQRCRMVMEVIEPYADILVDITEENVVEQIKSRLTEELAVRSKAANTFGEIVRVTTFGESHGPALGAVLDGIEPGIPIDPAEIQAELDRRRPGQSKVATARNEPDQVRILSGVFEGKTTGAPIGLLIENKDQDSSKYEAFRNMFRPGHADFTFWKKYGIRDHRGGGRSSGRETAARVAGGAVAKKILSQRGVRIIAYSIEIAGIKAETIDYDQIEKNIVRCGDPVAAEKMQDAIVAAKQEGDSVGGIVEVVIKGLPAGLGDPVFAKLDARLAAAFCSLGAVKGIEFGDGFQSAKLKASQFNDQMNENGFLSNHAGGILGGISTGQDIIIRLAIKPTPSITKTQKTVDLDGTPKDIEIHGRHDPCIVPRIIPVTESMAALVLLDAWNIQSRYSHSLI